MLPFLFIYEDMFSGKVAIDCCPNDPRKTYSHLLSEYDESLVKSIDEIVARAKDGDRLSSVDTLLIAARFIEKKWPIPDSLAEHISTALENAAIDFGHTQGRAEKKYSAVCRALGLVGKRGRNHTRESVDKYTLIHGYIRLRMKLYNETLYLSAKHATEAFKGTRKVSHDACEKIYNEWENVGGKPIDPSMFMVLKMNPELFKPIVFNDDDFLRKVIPYLNNPAPSNKKAWLEMLGI